MRVLVLGASGMLGNAMFRVLSERQSWEVSGTVRSGEIKNLFSPNISERLVVCGDLQNHDVLIKVFHQVRPEVVINCISLPRQLLNLGDPLTMIPMYALLPHQLAALCGLTAARLIHISTDGVFSGAKGRYTENDPADAQDTYGITKFLGEVHRPHSITLRTSMIGHELQGTHGLLGWFLSQEQCKCFGRVIFSGLPTVALAQIIRDVVIPRPDLNGLYHVAAQPISKFNLLRLVAEVYCKTIDIVRDDSLVMDRSLDAERFRLATGYVPPDWPELVRLMRSDWVAFLGGRARHSESPDAS
jgi:dTDP-4-dehydrorhamnose reductase